MRPALRTAWLLIALACLAQAPAVHAAGVFLRWDQCYGDGGVSNKNFACDTNTGSETLVAGFQLGADMTQVNGNEAILDVAAAGASLPAWWQLGQAGTCRSGVTSMDFVISPGAVHCAEWAPSADVGGGFGLYQLHFLSPNSIRINAACAVVPGELQNVSAGQEYFAFNLVIAHRRSVGTGSCDGCSIPACIHFTRLKVNTPDPLTFALLSGPANGTGSDFVTWQGGVGATFITTPPLGWCAAATPTVKRTWGAVKALYR